MLDTNVMLPWLLDDVPEQTKAVDHLFATSTEMVVPDVALIEVVFVLERVMMISRPTIVAAIRSLIGLANVRMDRRLWAATLSEYRLLPKLSIADVFLAVQAEKSGETPLATFDRKLAHQMNSAVLVGDYLSTLTEL